MGQKKNAPYLPTPAAPSVSTTLGCVAGPGETSLLGHLLQGSAKSFPILIALRGGLLSDQGLLILGKVGAHLSWGGELSQALEIPILCNGTSYVVWGCETGLAHVCWEAVSAVSAARVIWQQTVPSHPGEESKLFILPVKQPSSRNGALLKVSPEDIPSHHPAKHHAVGRLLGALWGSPLLPGML